MPFVTLPFDHVGPLIDVFLVVSRPYHDALIAAGKPVPPAVCARLLIDTGATCTNIDPTVISKLGIASRGTVPVHTPSTGATPHMTAQYDVGLVIPLGKSGQVHCINALPVLASNLACQGIQGLLGRDVLQRGIFTVNGVERIYLLGF
jgi:hypothetical protein